MSTAKAPAAPSDRICEKLNNFTSTCDIKVIQKVLYFSSETLFNEQKSSLKNTI